MSTPSLPNVIGIIVHELKSVRSLADWYASLAAWADCLGMFFDISHSNNPSNLSSDSLLSQSKRLLYQLSV